MLKILFSSSLTRTFWVIRDPDGLLAGYVRYDLDRSSGRWICSIAFTSLTRGRGIGTFALQKTFHLLQVYRFGSVEAWVQKDNFASCNAFENSGYVLFDRQFRDGIEYCIFRR